MRRVGCVAAWLVVVGSLSVLVVGEILALQVEKGKSRPLLTKQLMKGLVKVQCTDLKKGLDAGPATPEDWDELALHAALLNEASFILMDDGRCPDGTWAEAASKVLRQGSADVLKAVEARNADGAKEAFAAMTKSCGACHKAHKGKKTTPATRRL